MELAVAPTAAIVTRFAGGPTLAAGGTLRLRFTAPLAAELSAGTLGAEAHGVFLIGDPGAPLVPFLRAGGGWRGAWGDVAQGQDTGAWWGGPGFGYEAPLHPWVDLRATVDFRFGRSPDFAVALGLQVHPPHRYDGDRDGVSDAQDLCRATPEDRDGWADDDGCPDPDNDGDSVEDLSDACPSGLEDRDGFLDNDGCPDPDNDGDGLPDVLDTCPMEPEDRDGHDDRDGCLDPDNDRDHLYDDVDLCPNVAEDEDGHEDLDGCPDPDNDGDGVGDLFDAAPAQPETINGWQDDDGAPDELPPIVRGFVQDPMPLAWERGEPSPASRAHLQLLAAMLATWPVRIELSAGPDVPDLAPSLTAAGIAPDRYAILPREAPGVGLRLAP